MRLEQARLTGSAALLALLHSRVARLGDARRIGAALKGSRLGEFWNYQTGDCRIITRIKDIALRVQVVTMKKGCEGPA